YVTANGNNQMCEQRVGTNFESQDPAIAHFGLGDAHTVSELRVVWPDGTRSVYWNLAADQRQIIAAPDPPPAGVIMDAHPNPFRTAVRITVPSPLTHDATLGVVDLAGRVVRRLPIASGQRFIAW